MTHRLVVVVAPMLALAACGSGEPTPMATPSEQPGRAAEDETAALAESARPPTPPSDRAPTCRERVAQSYAAPGEVVARHQGCRWDQECVLVELSTACGTTCPTVLASPGVPALRAAVAAADVDCVTFEADGCEPTRRRCAPERGLCVDGACVAELLPDDAAPDTARERPAPAVPPHNDRGLVEAPPRPPVGSAEEKARRLFDAIVHDDPARIMDFYFPREAFLLVKGIADPGGYHDRLMRRFVRDIHDLHAQTPDLSRAEFERFELVRRGGWVAVGEEGNRLPYWVSRHSFIHYRVDGQPRRLEVRVLITWDDEWYVTHLNEFH